MISIDSNKILLPFDCLDAFNPDAFDNSTRKRKGQILQDKYTVKSPIPGLKSIEVNPGANKVIIETSAKILKDNYLQGLNLNTLEQYTDTINSTGLVHIKRANIDQAQILAVDTTQNIAWNERTSFSDLIHSIQLCSVNPKYSNDLFNTRNNKGLVFTGNQTSIKCRMIIYDKYTELIAKKENKLFLESCNNPNKLLNQAKGIIRVEQNNTSFASIRTRLKVADNNIMSVLNSNENPNYKLLDTITSLHSLEQLELFERYRNKDMTIGEIVRMEGMRNIIEKCNYDKILLKEFLKSLSDKWDAWYYDRNGKPGFKTVLQRMRFEKHKTESFYFQTFNDFKELLKVA